MASEYVFVYAVDADRARAAQLAAAIADRGLVVVADEGAGSNVETYDFMYDAAAVVAVCGDTPSPVYRPGIANARNAVIPVKIAVTATAPAPFENFELLDLSRWNGSDDAAFEILIGRLEGLVRDAMQQSATKPPDLSYAPTLANDAAVEDPKQAVNELESLAANVRDVGMVLADDAENTRQVRDTLNEIGGSYRAVHAAIDQFFAAAAGADLAALGKLRGGTLAGDIHNGRGHCKRIGARYFGQGGMRSAVEARVSADELQQIDALFNRLTDADLDMFAALDILGATLTFEADNIFTLLLLGQEQEARRRLLHAHEVLKPLEVKLESALGNFKTIEESLGYAEDTAPEAPVVNKTEFNFFDKVSNSIIGNSFENSQVTLQSAGLAPDLNKAMEQLQQAVADLVAKLPSDEAVTTARDLEDLTKEVTSATPSAPIWRRLLENLRKVAETVSDVGAPVIKAVTEIAALL